MCNRRQFLAGTGAMFVAATLPRLLNPKTAFGAPLDDGDDRPRARRSRADRLVVEIGGDGRVTIYTGKVELGTGVRTTTMQLVADELDVPLEMLAVVEGDTWQTPDQGYTAGSQSNKTNYAATGGLRQAAAEARLALLNMAAPLLGAPVSKLIVKDGTVIGGNGQVTYARADRQQAVQPADHRQGGAEVVPELQHRRHQRPAHRDPREGHGRVPLHAGRADRRHGPRPRRAPADGRLQADQGQRLPGRQESAGPDQGRGRATTSSPSSPSARSRRSTRRRASRSRGRRRRCPASSISTATCKTPDADHRPRADRHARRRRRAGRLDQDV